MFVLLVRALPRPVLCNAFGVMKIVRSEHAADSPKGMHIIAEGNALGR